MRDRSHRPEGRTGEERELRQSHWAASCLQKHRAAWHADDHHPWSALVRRCQDGLWTVTDHPSRLTRNTLQLGGEHADTRRLTSKDGRGWPGLRAASPPGRGRHTCSPGLVCLLNLLPPAARETAAPAMPAWLMGAALLPRTRVQGDGCSVSSLQRDGPGCLPPSSASLLPHPSPRKEGCVSSSGGGPVAALKPDFTSFHPNSVPPLTCSPDTRVCP